MHRPASAASSGSMERGHVAATSPPSISEASSFQVERDDNQRHLATTYQSSRHLEDISSEQPYVPVRPGSFVIEPRSLEDEQSKSLAPARIDEYKFTYRKNHFAFGTLLTDFAVVILPLAILIFAVKIWYLNGLVTSATSFKKWQNAITLLGTAFPILFASVMGRLLAELARWRLEEGSSMGLLEQLMGSRTVGSTIVTILQLRTANMIAASLCFIWAFSPLGTQAILRMAILQPERNEESTKISHFDLFAPGEFSLGAGMGGSQDSPVAQTDYIGLLAALYTTLVMAPASIKMDPMDLWGNVKIPFLDSDTRNNWADVPTELDQIRYSSLVGIPIRLAPREGNQTFEIESSYIDLNCSDISRCGPSTCERRPANFTEEFIHDFDPPNGTWNGFERYRAGRERHASWNIALDRFVDEFWQQPWNNSYALNSPTIFFNETGVRAGTTNLLVQIVFRTGNGMVTPNSVQAICGVTQKYVESRVLCSKADASSSRACKVVAQRASMKTYAPKDISQLSFPTTFEHISDQLPLATTRDAWAGNSNDLSIYYTTDPMFEKVGTGDQGLGLAFTDIDENEFGPRFNQLLNTFFMLGQMKLLVMSAGGAQHEEATFQPNVTTNATISIQVEVFEISKTWILLCLLSCGVLLAGGISSVVITHLTVAPDVLGYVSTLVRNSQVDLPFRTNWLDGAELSQRIRKKRFRYGWTHQVVDGEPLIAIRLENETERVRDLIYEK